MPQTKRHRVSGSAVTTEFLQQARLGKHKAPAGGSGIEKIVGRSSQYCSAPGWDRQQEHQPATRNPPAGFHTAVRQTGMPRTEKPSAHALTGRKETATQALGNRGKTKALRARALVLRAKALPNFGRCGNPQQVAHPSKATPTASGLFYAHGKECHANHHPSHTTKDLIPGRGAFPNQRPTHHIPLAHSPPGQPLRQRLRPPARPDRRHRPKGHSHRSTRPHDV